MVAGLWYNGHIEKEIHMIEASKIEAHHTVLRIACDPKSPFYGMIDFCSGLLSLSVEDQIEIYNTMPPDLRKMVDNYMERGRTMSKDEHHNDIADQNGQAVQDQRDRLMTSGDFLLGKDLKLLRPGDLLGLRHDLKWYPNFFMITRLQVNGGDPDKENLWLFDGVTEAGHLEILSIWEDLLDSHPEQFGITLLAEGPEDRGEHRGDQNADGIFLKLQEGGEDGEDGEVGKDRKDEDLRKAVKQIRELREELNKLEGFQRDDPIDATPINVSTPQETQPEPPQPPEPPALSSPPPRPVPPLPPRISFNGMTESTKTYVERVIAERDWHREWERANIDISEMYNTRGAWEDSDPTEVEED